MQTLIAIPVYNEIKYVADVLAKVREHHDHILCVDDASTDGTSEYLQAQPGLHVVRHATNSGYGRSIIDAFAYAAANEYEWVITMDCDEQHEPEMIPAFKCEIETNQWDVISGTRYSEQNAPGDTAPGDRQRINATITAVVNDLFNWHLTDTFLRL